MDTTVDPDNLGDYLISARSFAEYRAMFALTDLPATVLDCPGGGSSFTAGACARGSRAVAVDPIYRRPAGELAELVLAETHRGSAHSAAGFDRYRWDFYGSVAGHTATRQASARVFARDLAEHPDRYISGELPDLPFPGGEFDLVLCSHFLFTYADRLDTEFHRAALRELARVGRDVRVFPLLDQAGREPTDLLRALLADTELDMEIRPVPYEFQRGGDQMLVISS